MDLPATYHDLLNYWKKHQPELIRKYVDHTYSFIPGLLPGVAVQLPGDQVLSILSQRIGTELLAQALDPQKTVPSPQQTVDHPNWIKQSNLVGINVRTIGSFWNVVKYAMTIPASQDAIHLLPIWEPGVVSSLYGMASWDINEEFYSEEWQQLRPNLDTVEKQLKALVNILHALGKKVGMDVIPHTDRYADIVLANPAYFEWLQRDDLEIIDHRANLHEQVAASIYQWLEANGAAVVGATLPADAQIFFGSQTPEATRLQWLFGPKEDKELRQNRKAALVDHLFRAGYEPVPATMGPPYRGIEVDPRPEARHEDGAGRVWRDYRIKAPQTMSRVFGPLVRYKLYERLNDNEQWEIDFARPRKTVWRYICAHFGQLQQQYQFDFMRGDMSHVQMRPAGVPLQVDMYYDLHKAVKHHIRQQAPHFAYFAESFLTAPNFIAYGDEVDHLEQADAETTLGDLQSMVVGSTQFLQNFSWYQDLHATRRVQPSFTLMTGDKDDPRFDRFYVHGNEARLFIALFLTDWPSYMGLGFETRDLHLEPAPNEHYTKLYVFKIEDGPKATHGPYVWGKNGTLFQRLTAIRLVAERILPEIVNATTHWLLPPDPTGGTKVIAWTQATQPKLVFVVNLNADATATNTKLPKAQLTAGRLQHYFSVPAAKSVKQQVLPENEHHWQMEPLEPGACRIYQIKAL